MVRKSIADEIIEDLEEFEDSEGLFLVMYDFTRSAGASVHPNFWNNLNRLFGKLGDGERIQLSVIECQFLKTAVAIKRLAERYKARTVVIYRADRVGDSSE